MNHVNLDKNKGQISKRLSLVEYRALREKEGGLVIT